MCGALFARRHLVRQLKQDVNDHTRSLAAGTKISLVGVGWGGNSTASVFRFYIFTKGTKRFLLPWGGFYGDAFSVTWRLDKRGDNTAREMVDSGVVLLSYLESHAWSATGGVVGRFEKLSYNERSSHNRMIYMTMVYSVYIESLNKLSYYICIKRRLNFCEVSLSVAYWS